MSHVDGPSRARGCGPLSPRPQKNPHSTTQYHSEPLTAYALDDRTTVVFLPDGRVRFEADGEAVTLAPAAWQRLIVVWSTKRN